MADTQTKSDVSEELAARLKPGTHPEGKTLPELQPCGQCDGVIFFGEGLKLVNLPDGTCAAVRTESMEACALAYLRPMSQEWHALRLARGFGRCKGISRPEVSFLITKQMRDAAAAEHRDIKLMFTQDERGIMAVQPKHRDHWKVFPLEAGVWGVLYV